MDREITITVTDEEARRIEERAASAGYDSVSDYVHSAVSMALLAREDSSLLGDEAIRAAIAEADADTRPAIPAQSAFENVRTYIRSLADAKAVR